MNERATSIKVRSPINRLDMDKI